MRTVAIVQARMGSIRLPGKVMLRLGGRTVLAHVLERCAMTEGIDEVCCATVEGPQGDQIAAEALRCGATVFRGSEQDVLDRYYQASRSLQADHVMRITSDCPLIDPAVCALVIEEYRHRQADFACNDLTASWPHGLDCEIFTFQWLERAAREARKPSEREHVTPYIRNHGQAKVIDIRGPGGAVARNRWVLDTEADYRFLEALFEFLPPSPACLSWEEILDVVERHPWLMTINAGQDRREGYKKSLAEDALCAREPA